MYNNSAQPLQNNKCFSCRFCVWDEERRMYVCDVKGCYENSKYIEYIPEIK